jgi:hypothetical protein
VRAAPSVHGIPIRAIPPNVSRALFILFIVASAFLLKTFSAPENIFQVTQSRLQIPTDTLFTRLSNTPPRKGLSDADNALRGKIISLESRLLYFQYGPKVLTDCSFCNTEDPNSYLYYALPAILAPHLFNLCILALVTSGLFTGKEGSIWRTSATVVGIAVALADVYFVATYKYQDNSRATRLEDIDTFFWRMRTFRALAIAAVDGLLGWMLYLSSTNRAFLTPLTPAERVESATKSLDRVRNKMSTVGVLRNTINRDEELRSKSQTYWVQEGRLMGETMEEREVVEGINDALENRINMATITADAGEYARSVVEPLQGLMHGNP